MDAGTAGEHLDGFLHQAAANPRPLACIVLVENKAEELAGLGEVAWKGLPAEKLLARVLARLALPG